VDATQEETVKATRTRGGKIMRDLIALIGIALLGIILIIAGLLLIVTEEAGASPYLVSDPSSDNATSCQFESFQLPCTIDATKAIRVDLAALPVGTYSIRARYCTQSGLWCGGWSTQFPFTRPSISAVGNIKLSP